MPVNDVYWDGDHEGVDVDYDDDGFKNSVACDYGRMVWPADLITTPRRCLILTASQIWE